MSDTDNLSIYSSDSTNTSTSSKSTRSDGSTSSNHSVEDIISYVSQDPRLPEETIPLVVKDESSPTFQLFSLLASIEEQMRDIAAEASAIQSEAASLESNSLDLDEFFPLHHPKKKPRSPRYIVWRN